MSTIITTGSPPGITSDIDPTTPGTQPSIVVYVKEVWDSTFFLGSRETWWPAHYLQAVSATQTIGNIGVGRAEFLFHYGQILREDGFGKTNLVVSGHDPCLDGFVRAIEASRPVTTTACAQ